jgi:hypothetical protein
MRKISTLFKLIAVCALLATPFSTAMGATDGWTSVGNGIDYQMFRVNGTNFYIHVARMNRSNQSDFIESGITSGSLNAPNDTIRNMTSLYDGALNTWGTTNTVPAWGGRNQVVVSINGDYQNKDNKSLPEDGFIHNGWYDRRFIPNTGWSGFVWPMDREAFIGECVANLGDHQFILYGSTPGPYITGINSPDGDLVIYTPDYGSATPHLTAVHTEIVLQMDRPATTIPKGHTVNGKVLSINQATTGSTPIPFDAVVLVGSNTSATDLNTHAHLGNTIGLTQEISSLDTANCKAVLKDKDWANTYSSIGGAYAFLRDGTSYSDSPDDGAIHTNPRTAIAMNDSYIFFIVVEGVEANKGGMTFEEMGNFASGNLGARWGIAEDGGGSSVMVINGKIVNHLADCVNRSNSPDCERAVPNGIMMVVQQPKTQLNFFAPGANLTTRAATALRLGPGTNYAALASLPASTPVTIVHDPHGLDGVLAKGQYWWKVSAAGQQGWISQKALPGQEINLPLLLNATHL